jgi:glucokinase
MPSEGPTDRLPHLQIPPVPPEATAGRPPVVAVDLGGTNLRVALVGADGSVVARVRVPTPHEGSIAVTVAELVGTLDTGPAGAAVVAVPGPVEYRSGRVLWAPHLPERWIAELTEESLSDRLGLEVSLANDADLAAIGESYFGAGRAARDVVFLTVSTGIGAGVLLDRRLVRGRRSVAEVGHTIIDRDAFLAGRPATLEQLASGSAIAHLAARAGVAAHSGEELEALEERGEDRAGMVWEEIVDNVTIGIVNIARCFGPELVIIGGGLGRERELFEPVRERLRALVPTIAEELTLAPAMLGDDAGIVGAAGWSQAVAARE